jgi:glycosyltransferase involved in cell wall biosynthesis
LGGSADSRLLKILHIDPEINWGGGEAQVLGLLTYLAAKGHRNDLLAHPGGVLFGRCQNLDVRTRPLVMRNDIDLRCVPALRRLIDKMAYDIVHFHTKRAHTLALWLPSGRGRPKYLVTRRMDYPESGGWYTERLYNRRVDGVVAISRTIAELLARAGVEEQKIRYIPSGIEPRRFELERAPAEISAGVTVVGCVGGLDERKGHRYLIDAAARLKAQGLKIHYRIAGDGPLRAQHEVHVARAGLREEVRFLGFVNDAAEFLAGVDVVAMPSLFEGLGVAALEAMAAAKPVVASRVGGLAEAVVDGVTGLLVPPRDSAALASAIARLVGSPELALTMGRQGRDRVRHHFSLENTARQNESFYFDLLDASA